MARRAPDERTAGEEQRLIERALARVREESGLSVAFWGRVSEEGDRLHLDTFAGEVLGALPGLSVGFGTGIGGKAATLRRPLAVENYVGAERISHHYDHVIRAERMQSVLAIPIVVRRRVLAVLYGATRDSPTLGERALRHAADGARDLEQQLAVQVALVEEARRARESALRRADGEQPSGAEWETVRSTFARLRVLAADCDDDRLRDELTSLADSLTLARGDVHLTAREIDVLACVAQGLTNAETARQLGLGAETVKSYLRSSMRRLGAASRLEAVVAARRAGLLP